MKLFNNVRNYIDEDKFNITIYNDKIDIINYKEIDEISNNKIIVLGDKKVIINGKNLNVSKLFNNELLIKGLINNIIINE